MWAFLLLQLCKLQALLYLFSAGCIINCSVWWYDRTASSGSSQRVSCWAIWALKHGDNDQEPKFINRLMCFHSAYKAHTSQDQTKYISYGHKPKKVFNLYERDKKIKQPVSDAVEGWDKGEKWRQSVNAAMPVPHTPQPAAASPGSGGPLKFIPSSSSGRLRCTSADPAAV